MVLPGYRGRWQRAERASNLAKIKAGRWQGQDSSPEPSSLAREGSLDSQLWDMGLFGLLCDQDWLGKGLRTVVCAGKCGTLRSRPGGGAGAVRLVGSRGLCL